MCVIIKAIKNLISISCVFFVFITVSFAQALDKEPISMQDALNQSMAYNKRIQSEISKFDAAKYSFEQATRRALPTISANTSYGMQRSKVGSLPYESYPEKRYGISLNQDIYTFGRLTASSEKARYDMLVALVNIDIIKSEESLKFIKTYLDLYGNFKTQELMKNHINIFNKLITITQTQALSGEANHVDVIQLEAELLTTQANLEKTIAESKGLVETYNNLTGYFGIPMLSNPLSICHIIDTKEVILDTINQHNFEIHQAQETINSSNQDVELSKSNLYPSISLAGNARYVEGDSAFFRSEAQTSSAVIQVNIPIFDRGMEYSRIKEAKALKQAAEYDFMDTKNQIGNQFENDYNIYQAQKLVIKAYKKSLQAMNLLLKKTVHEKKLGFKSTYDVLEIKRKLIQTKINLINSHVNTVFYGCKIMGAQGQLPIITSEFKAKR
jgi:outer membrane protein